MDGSVTGQRIADRVGGKYGSGQLELNIRRNIERTGPHKLAAGRREIPLDHRIVKCIGTVCTRYL